MSFQAPINRVTERSERFGAALRRHTMLTALPDELIQLILAKLDAATACRLSQVDKAMQQWVLFHHKEWVHAWRHARAWLVLCERAKARVSHRRAGIRGHLSVVWNHFTPVGPAAPRHVRCCCTDANGNACGMVLNMNNTRSLWNHLQRAHAAIYAQLRPSAV